MRKALGKTWFLLGLILLLAVFLRTYNIPQTLLFHFDQGYHGLAIREIWENKTIALLGHKTDAEGVFHGSLFYYFMLPFYLLSSWNPVGVSISLAILDSLTVIFVFLIGKELLGRKVGLLSALFYAVSYALVSYSRWLSNVTPIPFFSSVFFYFLLKSYQGKIHFLAFASLFLGIIVQFNGAIGFFFLPIWFLTIGLFWQKLWRKKAIILASVFTFLLPSSPLIFFDLRHNFLVSNSIKGLFFKESGLGFGLGKIITNFNLLQSELVNLLSYTLTIFALVLFLIVIGALLHAWCIQKKEFKQTKTLLLFLSIPLLGLLIYPGGIHQFFFIGVLPLAVLFVAWGLVYWMKVKILKPAIIVFTLAIIFVNLYYWQGFLKPGFNLIPVGTRNLITLEDRLKATDFIYQKADGQPFQTPIYIIPYNQEQPWDYVFAWYGKKKYGYFPTKYFGKTFVIYEPDYDFPYRLTSWLGKIEEDHGGVVAEFKTHDLTVQERER